jgi:hypothetical protein
MATRHRRAGDGAERSGAVGVVDCLDQGCARRTAAGWSRWTPLTTCQWSPTSGPRRAKTSSSPRSVWYVPPLASPHRAIPATVLSICLVSFLLGRDGTVCAAPTTHSPCAWPIAHRCCTATAIEPAGALSVSRRRPESSPQFHLAYVQQFNLTLSVAMLSSHGEHVCGGPHGAVFSQLYV